MKFAKHYMTEHGIYAEHCTCATCHDTKRRTLAAMRATPPMQLRNLMRAVRSSMEDSPLVN
jgi:hypothetical protein